MAMNETRTTGRWRTLIAIFVTLAYLSIYIFSVAWLMELIEAWPLWVRGILFCVFGIVWIFPLGPMLRWTAKDPNSQLHNP